MAQPGGKAREISLGEDFGDVTVKANGTAVDIHGISGSATGIRATALRTCTRLFAVCAE